MLRAESEGSHGLILIQVTDFEYVSYDHGKELPDSRIAEPFVVYRYRPHSEQLEEVGIREWKQATGVISEHVTYSTEPFHLDRRTDTLTYGGTVVKTAGRTVMDIAASPTGGLVALLSGTGKRGFGVDAGFVLGRAGVHGGRLHQFFRRSDGNPVGDPLVLPFDENVDTRSPTWSVDGKYVIYTEWYFRSLCVIPVQ